MRTPINVRKDMLFLFAILWIVGFDASSQPLQNLCALKIFVNDPYAQIFVDGKMAGAPPQIIPCTEKEKSILVKSSDGQVFSRLMTAKNNFDLSNSTLNVIFHKKMADFVASAKTEKPPIQVLPESQSHRDVGSTPQVPSMTPEQSTIIKQDTPILTLLAGTYIQIFALKNLDMSKIEQDITNEYHGKVIQNEFTVCPWQSSKDAQQLTLVLLGPYNKALALETQNKIGGKSFIVTDPQCIGDYTKVSR
jgi:hypothetical protein